MTVPPRTLTFLCGLGVFLVAGPVFGDTPAAVDAIVAVGGGFLGTWITEFNAANLGDTPYQIEVNATPEFVRVDACAVCPWYPLTVPPRGTTPGTLFAATRAFGFKSLYVIAEDGVSLPSVRMRIISQADPSQTVPVPTFRLSTLIALNPSVLVFPGAVRTASGAARSNLALANLYRTDGAPGASVSLMIEVFSQTGSLLGATPLSLDYGQTVYLVDLLGSLGVSALENGEIRVTKTAGGGVFWGTLFIRDANGAFASGAGRVP